MVTMDRSQIVKFGVWLTGHDEETIKQMYNDYSSSPQAKNIPMQLPFKPACENCNLKIHCGIYRYWKDNEADYFGKDVSDFSCRHFIMNKLV